MKILSIAVPCYNSQDYMEHCVETLLTGGEKVEIIIVAIVIIGILWVAKDFIDHTFGWNIFGVTGGGH